MNTKLRKILEFLLVIGIIALSVVIFLFRDKLQNIGEVGYLGLFALCFLANATVLLPSPSLMIAASCALILNPILVAIFAALGSTLGELIGYAFGHAAGNLSPKLKAWLDKLDEKTHNELLMVFILAVLPLPVFDIVGIYSGGTKLHLLKFFLVCFAGKFIKMLVYTRLYDILEWVKNYYPAIGGLL